VTWKQFVGSTNLLAIYLASFCVSFSFYFYVTFLPKYLKEQFNVDYAQSEIMSGLPLLVGGLACLGGGRLSDWLIQRTGSKRWGRSLLGIVGFGGAGLCALVVAGLDSAWPAILLMCVAFGFQDVAIPGIWSLPADVGGRYAGTLGGCMNTVGAIGGMLSPLVAARLSSDFGWNAVFLVYGGMYLLGALAWVRIDAAKTIWGIR
jgi:MFS family permease